jgi:hypothetical protein
VHLKSAGNIRNIGIRCQKAVSQKKPELIENRFGDISEWERGFWNIPGYTLLECFSILLP